MNPFLDSGWIRHALTYWAERPRQDPKEELAWLRVELRKEGP